MSGFENLIHDILVLNGIPSDWIHIDSKLELPGYFRPTKKWDLLVINKNHLISVVEMKSQVGPSFEIILIIGLKKLLDQRLIF